MPHVNISTLAMSILLVLLFIPSLLVLAELFWFGGRCPKGGPHQWGEHPLGGAWVLCGQCGHENF